MTREVEKKVTGWESERDSKGDGVWKEKQTKKGKETISHKMPGDQRNPLFLF